MKIHKKEIVSVERITQETIVCDMCGESSANEWRCDGFVSQEVEVSLRQTFTDYPESASWQVTRLDLCPACFVNRLLPFAKSHGATPDVTEWDR